MDLPRDHTRNPSNTLYNDPLRQPRIMDGALVGKIRGLRSPSLDWTSKGDRPASASRAMIAINSVALGMLFVTLLGTSGTALCFCLMVVVGLMWRIGRADQLVITTLAVAANMLVLPTVLMPASPGPHPWHWIPLWCLEGLLINWLLIQLYKDLTGQSPPGNSSCSTSGLSTDEESTLQLLLESSSQCQERLRLMVESIGDFAIIMLTPRGRVASWNVGAERILGYRAGEILGRNHAEFYIPEDVLRRIPERQMEMSEAEGTFEAEGWRRRKDDTRLWAYVGLSPMRSASGSLLGFATVIRDMTEKRRAEESLRHAHDELEVRVHERTSELAAANAALHAEVKERIQAERVLEQQSLVLRSILDSIGDAVIVAEGGRKPLIFNSAARALFGIGDDPLTLEEWLDLEVFHSAESWNEQVAIPYHRRPMIRALHGEQFDDLELLVRKPGSATVRWLVANSRALRDSPAGTRGAVVAFRDITDRRRHAEELRAAKDAAEAASRAKDQFLAVLSHELRTPLTPILLAVSDLLERDDVRRDVRSSLGMIHRNAKLEARLIDDLLDLTRATTGRLSLALGFTDVHHVIQLAAEVCRGEIVDSQLELRLQLLASRHCLTGDPARLQQVFWNLIKNAVKFTPRGGIITIRTWNHPERDTGEATLLAEVSDTGIGIAADRLPRIFNAFEPKRAEEHRRYGGLGLGLAISRSVIEAHGGRLTASSGGENCGAVFTIELTTQAPPTIKIVTDDGSRARLDGGSGPEGLRILLIDDNRDTLNYLASVLERRGHRVNPASNFRTASNLAEVNTYDLVISDIELPDGSGLDLIRELAIKKPTPGIAVSGFGTADDIAMSLRAGFAEHLIKPIDVRKLDEAIFRVAGSIGGRRSAVNHELYLTQASEVKACTAGD